MLLYKVARSKVAGQKSEVKLSHSCSSRAEQKPHSRCPLYYFFVARHTPRVKEKNWEASWRWRRVGGWASSLQLNIVTCTGDHRMNALLLVPCTRGGGSGDAVHIIATARRVISANKSVWCVSMEKDPGKYTPPFLEPPPTEFNSPFFTNVPLWPQSFSMQRETAAWTVYLLRVGHDAGRGAD